MVEYKFILEVARHGARAPSILYDLTAPGVANFEEPMELTQLGAKMHYASGKYVREKYFADQPGVAEGFVSMKDAGVYAQSTDINRTKESATSQLQGIFGTDMTFPALEQSVYPLIINVD